MKEWIFIIAVILGVLLFVIVFHWLKENDCKKYGSDWDYRGGYASYCVNSNGDIKGV